MRTEISKQKILNRNKDFRYTENVCKNRKGDEKPLCEIIAFSQKTIYCKNEMAFSTLDLFKFLEVVRSSTHMI